MTSSATTPPGTIPPSSGVVKLPVAGVLPSLLCNWRVLKRGGGNEGGGSTTAVGGGDGTTFLGGSLMDTQSRIWFPLCYMGRLGTNPADGGADTSIVDGMIMEEVSGGFAKAAGGRYTKSVTR